MQDQIEYRFELTKDHLLAAVHDTFDAEAAKIIRNTYRKQLIVSFVIGIGSFFLLVGLFVVLGMFAVPGSIRPKPVIFWTAAVISLVVTSLNPRLRIRKRHALRTYLRLRKGGLGVGVVGPVTVRFDTAGVHWTDQWSSGSYGWALAGALVSGPDVCTISFCGQGTVVLPRSVVGDDAAIQRLADLVDANRERSGGEGTLIRDFLSRTDTECPRCGYNLRGAQETRCPECGRGIDREDL